MPSTCPKQHEKQANCLFQAEETMLVSILGGFFIVMGLPPVIIHGKMGISSTSIFGVPPIYGTPHMNIPTTIGFTDLAFRS